MLSQLFRQIKLETRLSLLTGFLFFVPLLLTSISTSRFISQEHNAMYGDRAARAAASVAASPLADKIFAAWERPGSQRDDLDPLVGALLESALAKAVHIRYVALKSRDGQWLFYPEQDARLKPLAMARAAPGGPVNLSPEEISPGIFQTPFIPAGGGDAPRGMLALGFSIGDMEDLVEHITLPLQQMMLTFMLLGLLLAVFMAQSIKKILLGLEPEEIATLLQERNAMLGIMTEGVIAITPSGKVTLVNGEARRILAMTDIDSAPEAPSLRQSPLVRRLRDIVRSGSAERNVEQNLHGVTVLANYMPVNVDGQVAGGVVTFRDMSEVRQLAESITDINRYLDALRSQSHEFLNKLHVIMGLVNSGKLDDLRGYVEELVESNTQEGRVIHDAIKDPLIAGFLASKYSNAREMGVSLHFAMEGVLPPLEDGALRNGLVTILGNLMDNALDAVQSAAEPRVLVTLDARGGDLRIEVADNGPGIDQNSRERLFSKGYSSKGPSRGLGLWLVQKTLASLDGRVSLESEPGRGSRFGVVLPLPPESGED